VGSQLLTCLDKLLSDNQAEAALAGQSQWLQ
jgi:hypothetical protein